MTDNKKNKDEAVDNTVTLVDEATGEEIVLTLVARYDKENTSYFAFCTDEKEAEYVLLKREGDSDDALFETIDDDDEYDEIEDYFNDLLFGEVDYD